MSIFEEITADDLVSAINLLPDKWRNKILDLYEGAYSWKERLDGAPIAMKAMIANIIGHNVIAVFKAMRDDDKLPKIRALTLEALKWIFDLPTEWLPKWA